MLKKRKFFWLGILFLLLIGAGWGYYQFQKPHESAAGERANVTIEADSLYAQYASNFTRNHYEVWMVDYPGFGKSTGTLSEKIMYGDAALLYQMARSQFSKDSILIYGKSLGSGIASQLASVKDCKRLILETPYYSIDALMNHYAFIYPAAMMAKYHFPTYQYLRQVEVPVTLIHGTGDEIIPFSQSTRLKSEIPSVQLVSIKNGKHNNLSDIPFFHQQLDSLLNAP